MADQSLRVPEKQNKHINNSLVEKQMSHSCGVLYLFKDLTNKTIINCHKHHLRHPLRRHPGLIVEDPAKVVSVGEHVGLSG